MTRAGWLGATLLLGWAGIVNATMIDVPLERVAGDAAIAVRGRVASQQSYWTDDGRTIFTDVTVRVEVVLKGEGAPGDRLTVRVEGGMVGDEGIHVSHHPSFQPDEDVVLFLEPTGSPDSPVYRLRHLEQGKFTLIESMAIGYQGRVESLEVFNRELNRVLPRAVLLSPAPSRGAVEPESGSPAVQQMPVVSMIVPQPVSGGTGTPITITGTGFGAAADTVYFPGNMKVTPSSWGSGFVIVTVPSTWSGTVTLYSSASGLTSTPFAFEITFSNWAYWATTPTFWVNQNGVPGCTLTDVVDRVNKAMWTWECASGFDGNYGGTTPLSSLDHNDGMNVYAWSDTGFSPGLVASASTAYNGARQIIEADVTFNSQHLTWSCSGAAPDMDVENVATHEFGHSLGFGDLYGPADNNKTMFGNTANGEVIRRSLWPSDVDGAETIYPRAGRPNLTQGTPGGWAGPVVPDDFPNATANNAPLPPVLTGNWPGYVSVAQTNNGLDCAASNGGVLVQLDGAVVASPAWAGVWAIGSTQGWINQASTVRSGRHTYTVIYDSDAEIVESNEADNVFDAQFAWSPYGLADQFPVTRSVPPDPGLLPASNCDGFQFSGNWWGGVAIMARDPGDDYDLDLFDDYVGSTQGYQTVLADSRVGSGIADFVMVNGNVVGFAPTRWAGVNRYLAPVGSDVVVHQSNQVGPTLFPSATYAAFESTGVVTVAADEIIKIHEVFLADTSLTYGFYMNRVSGTAELNLGIYAPNVPYSGRVGGTFGSGGGNSETLIFQPTETGYHALVVFKDGSGDLPLSASYEISIGPALSNLNASVVPPGFTSSIVPRNTGDATTTSAVLPAVLTESNATSYLNWSVQQEGPNYVPPFNTELYLDDAFEVVQVWPSVTEHAPGPWSGLNLARTVRGGRHTLTVIGDAGDNVPESNEGDNTWSEQWVWAPLTLNSGVPEIRNQPPVPGALVLPNGDGMKFTRPATFAWAVAMAPTNVLDDYDLELYDDYASSTSGFSNLVVASTASAGITDFVVGHYPQGTLVYYPSVTRFASGAGADLAIEANDASSRNAIETGDYPAQVMAQDRVVDVYEAYLTAETSYEFNLFRDSGTSDLMLAVVTDFGNLVYPRGQGMEEGTPLSEDQDRVSYTAQVSDWHPIVVVRPDGTDLAPVGYSFNFGPVTATATPDDTVLPPVIRLVGAYPNPVRTRSRISFELPSHTVVALQVLDVRGRQVRTLVDGSFPAGRHDIVWDGRDERGLPVSAGRYFARLRANGEVQSTAVVVLR